LFVGTAVLIQGCWYVAVGAGAAGTVAYVKGELKAVESKDIDTVYAATKKAVEQLDLKVTQDLKDALGAKVVARDAQDKKIMINLKKMADETTELSVRVGTFGSRTKSNLIYQKIHDNLK
jgi:hypothetical protein